MNVDGAVPAACDSQVKTHGEPDHCHRFVVAVQDLTIQNSMQQMIRGAKR